MTADQHLHRMIWDLLVTVARLQAELDALKAAAPPPAPEEGNR